MWLITLLAQLLVISYWLIYFALNLFFWIIGLIAAISAKFVYISVLVYLFLLAYNRYKKKEYIDSKKKAVLISGCDSGFGNSLALRLNEKGFRVYATVLEVSNTGSQELLNSSKFVDQMVVMKMDPTNDEEVKEVYSKVCADLVANELMLWAIVNNAGEMSAFQLEWGTIDEFKRLFETNVYGVIRVTRAFLPLIRKSKGRIVNVSSIHGQVSLKTFGAYSMTKSALIAFSDTLRKELHTFGITVSLITPGSIKDKPLLNKLQQHTMDRIWKQTDELVKEEYGSAIYDQAKQSIATIISDENFSDLTNDIVINDMIDAVTNIDPGLHYKSIGSKYARVMYEILTYVNKKWTDLFDQLLY